jgi:histidine triad (HIT) family protein
MVDKNKCVFCKIIAGEIKAEIVADEENFMVINDAHPVSEGHCLVIPKKHYETLLDMPSTLGSELLDLAKKQSLRLIKEKKADGIKLVTNNFEAGGQVVPHFHLHVIPEKKGVKRKVHV